MQLVTYQPPEPADGAGNGQDNGPEADGAGALYFSAEGPCGGGLEGARFSVRLDARHARERPVRPGPGAAGGRGGGGRGSGGRWLGFRGEGYCEAGPLSVKGLLAADGCKIRWFRSVGLTPPRR